MERLEIADSAPDMALILLNLLTHFLNEVILFISQRQNVNGIAYLIVMCVTILLYAGFFIATRVWSIRNVRKSVRPIPKYRSNQLVSTTLVKLSAVVGGVCYLVGNNIQIVFILQSQAFNCGIDCQNKLSDAATMLLVLASLLFSVNEIHGGKLFELLQIATRSTAPDEDDGEWPMWVRISESIAFIRVFDSSFSTIASIPDANSANIGECAAHETALIWIMFVVLMLIWGVLVSVIMGPGIINAWRVKDVKCIVMNSLVTVTILIATGAKLISTNLEPLGCVLDCDTALFFTANCQRLSFHIIRTIMLFLSLALLCPFCFCILIRWIKLTRQLGQDGRIQEIELQERT